MLQPIYGDVAWRGADLAARDDWIYRFSAANVAEIEAALRAVRARGLAMAQVTRDDFPLPHLASVLDETAHTLEGGRGFQLMRGLPVDRWTAEETELVLWGIGTHLGIAVSQNADGDLMGHVRDQGRDIHDPNARGYQTRKRLPFHTDSSDVVGLMCYRKARNGGLSTIVSSVTLHNIMLAERPDLLEILYQPFYTDHRGEEWEGQKPYYVLPIFNAHNGLITVRYVRGYIESAQRFAEAPRLTAKQIEALDHLDALAVREDLSLVMDLEPGDIQWLNNYVTFHGRTRYLDHEEGNEKRHMLRLWLTLHRGRRLPEHFAHLYGSIEPGVPRGGIPARGGRTAAAQGDFR